MAIIYAATTGTPTGAGTILDPYDLPTGLTSQVVGDTLFVRGGVYTVADQPLVMGPANTGTQRSIIQNYSGERPVVTIGTRPPPITMRPYLTLDGLWFGGPKAVVNNPVQGNDGKLIQNCTFWGYLGCLTDGDSVNNQYLNNRLINCSGGTFHDQYITRRIFAAGQAGCVHQDNIHLGGSAYQIHLWHDPRNAVVRNNFCGDAGSILAVQGRNHIVENNIFWSSGTTYNAFNFSNEGDGEFAPFIFYYAHYVLSHNLFGQVGLSRTGWPPTQFPMPDVVGKGNVFMGVNPPGQDPNGAGPGWYFGDYVLWAEAALVADLGVSSTTLNSTISTLETSFTQTPTQIQADSTIEANFTKIRNAMNAYARSRSYGRPAQRRRGQF